jgi:NitT/TauT family transport system substrate-binding protein
MKKKMLIMTALLAISALTIIAPSARSADTAAASAKPVNPNKTYRYLWSHYAGWELWQYLSDSGIMKKWADKEGVKIEIVLINDYVTSINQYTSGQADGCAMTIMDALDMPAAGGVDSDVLAVGDYSNGNDGVVLMNGKTLADVKGRKIMDVQGSCSSYLLSRGLESVGLKDSDVTEVMTSDSSIGATFASSGDQGACVTWNPILLSVRNLPHATLVFDSSKIPGEIQDLLVVRHDTPEAVKKALVGAWFEGLAIMQAQGKQTDDAIDAMAKFAGGTTPEFRAQLKTTAMYYTPSSELAFVNDPNLPKIIKKVAGFCFDHGLFPPTAKSADFIGVQLPNGTVVGNPKNVKIHYVNDYVQALVQAKP